MSEGASEIYSASGGEWGFWLWMPEGPAMYGHYRGPLPAPVARECDAQEAVWGSIERKTGGSWFTGAASGERWMRLRASGVQMACVANGFVVQSSAHVEHAASLDDVRTQHGLVKNDGGYLLHVPKESSGLTDSTSPTGSSSQLRFCEMSSTPGFDSRFVRLNSAIPCRSKTGEGVPMSREGGQPVRVSSALGT